MPVWAWGVAGAAVIGGVWWYMNRGSSGSAAATPATTTVGSGNVGSTSGGTTADPCAGLTGQAYADCVVTNTLAPLPPPGPGPTPPGPGPTPTAKTGPAWYGPLANFAEHVKEYAKLRPGAPAPVYGGTHAPALATAIGGAGMNKLNSVGG